MYLFWKIGIQFKIFVCVLFILATKHYSVVCSVRKYQGAFFAVMEKQKGKKIVVYIAYSNFHAYLQTNIIHIVWNSRWI